MISKHRSYRTVICLFAALLHITNGCQIDGITNWWVPVNIDVIDVFSGSIFTRSTTSITGISSAVFTEGLNAGPYMTVSHSNNEFVIQTNNNFADYEENETVSSIGLTVVFTCTGGSTSTLVFAINVQDTNNNVPQFRPSDEYEFKLIPPLPPGYLVTGCFDDIIVRDIDLTTQRIDFEIFDSPYFSISYDAASSTTPKEFKAQIRTTTFIRNIPEPIQFRISATDVDLTNDPPHTTYATVRILSDGNFELPEELVFNRTFYMATYDEENLLTLQEPISLQQGFHNDVQFSLDPEPEYAQYFTLNVNANQVTLNVVTPLPEAALVQQKIYLVIRAVREYTSGASATIVIQLPAEISLEFEQPNYKGSIIDNTLELSDLVLSQGYESGPLTIQIISDHESFFSATSQINSISLSMSPLEANIIEQNNFLNLQILASTNRSSASTIVTLDIIKNDTITPIFEKSLYEGTYENGSGLSLETIVIIQGYDSTVQVNLRGEHAMYFLPVQLGPNINLTVSNLPIELYQEQNLLLTIEVTKPRTVGANAAISIALPPEDVLEFEELNYKGTIVDNILHLSELVLIKGYYNELVSVVITSDYSSYFSTNIQTNTITISMTPLDTIIIEQNNFLNLQVVASTNRSSTTAVVTLDIIKDDTITPVFNRALYEGSYDPITGLSLDQIVLIQGYDNTVQVNIQGEYASYFRFVQSEANITLVVTSLPTELFIEQNLLLTVEATKPRTVGANAAISISLPTEIGLEFAQQIYNGVIEDNILLLSELLITQGYENTQLYINIQSDYASYFTAAVQNNIVTLSMLPLTANIIEENTFINLLVTASTNRSTASTAVTLEIIKNDTVTPVFERTMYEGTYDLIDGLTLDQIVIAQGYDSTVDLSLIGEFANYFSIVQVGQYMNLTSSPLPSDLFAEQHLFLTVKASKPRTVGANAAISIALPTARELAFASDTYSGTIQNSNLTIGTIELSTGYTEDVTFSLSGDFASYFTVANVQNQVSVGLQAQMPDSVISENNFLLLTLTASASNAVNTSTTILVEIIKEDVITPLFDQNIYQGTYLDASNINIEAIRLKQGYDNTVSFLLEGEHSRYFTLTEENNNIAITAVSTIPRELILSEKVLLFYVLAEKPMTVGANAAVAIRFPTELTEPTVIKFDKNTYIGALDNNILTLENIVVSAGFEAGTIFELSGDYSTFFLMSIINNQVTIATVGTLPSEILDRKFLVLEIQALRTNAVSASATIIIEVADIITPPLFEDAYYKGVYTVESGLVMDDNILLSQGYDETVTFQLEGGSSQWFDLSKNNNLLTISTNGIPEEVLENNNHLLFTIVATKPRAVEGRAVIAIDLPKNHTEAVVLRFTQTSYEGQIQNGTLQLSPVTLVGAYDLAVHLEMTGDYASYFSLTWESNIINIQLTTQLPAQIIADKTFIILSLEASYPEAISGFTTFILEIIKETDSSGITPVFGEAYYTGRYSAQGGLVFEHTIQLVQGFDDTVSFSLASDDSRPFTLVQNEQNSFGLSVNVDMIQEIRNTSRLIFSVVANKPESVSGQAAIIIDLTDISTYNPLLFAEDYYVGSMEDGILSLSEIILEEGYSTTIAYTLYGDYVNYFQLTHENGIFVLHQTSSLPTEIAENILVFVLEVQNENTRAHTTIIIQLEKDTDEANVLSFDEAYYVGSYSEENSFLFDQQIILINGYDELVTFTIEGENSQWFGLVQNTNTLRITQTSPIPATVVANNQLLLFTVNAQRPGIISARSTIVIELPNEIIETRILGFDRINYVGSIVNNTSTLITATLIEGDTHNVTFTLHGELASFFVMRIEGTTIQITLVDTIPEESKPENRIVLLEIQASAPQTISAYATIVFDIVSENGNVITPNQLIFEETYYVGNYALDEGLSFNTVMSLSEGYDANVTFGLEGVNSQWFELIRMENSATLILSSPIPAAVIANNNQLLFIINAQRPGSTSATATIIILLAEEFSEERYLGFDQINYIGSITNNSINIPTIELNEGYSSDVTFTLLGELSRYFALVTQDATVAVTQSNPIPEDLLANNRFIVLTLQASAPETLSAYATIILGINDSVIETNELLFEETFYVGNYTTDTGLAFESVISLAEGFDNEVVFSLEGENAQWFSLSQTNNFVRVVLSSPIPAAVVANHQQLIFSIKAERPGSRFTTATIVILLTDEIIQNQVLGFEQINYVGSMTNTSINLAPIILSEGYTPEVIFTLSGELTNYFNIIVQEAIVNIGIINEIPVELIPSNRLILLTLQASAPQTIATHATIVLEVKNIDDGATHSNLEFEKPYYAGSYTADDGFTFNSVISLVEGYDENVVFSLDGESSQWFELRQTENMVSVTLSTPIPDTIIINNLQLLFTIRAQRPDSRTAIATIIVLLPDGVNEGQILGFEQVNYVGSVTNTSISLVPIILTEGYTPDVTFTLLGELSIYFGLAVQGATVNIGLVNAIPDHLISSNRVILLTVQASAPQAMTTYATIVLEVVVDDNTIITDILEFKEPYYVGQYTAADGLVFNNTISLAEGFNENVTFSLDGENSQWFSLSQTNNMVVVILSNPIPGAVIANNQQLLFTIKAQRPNSRTAQATIAILITEEITEGQFLGFEQINYVGSITNTSISLVPIILSEGFTPDVTFSLHGEFVTYFHLVTQGETVNIGLTNTIPEDLIPSNYFIVMTLEASAPQSIKAHATIVLEVIIDDKSTSSNNLEFEEHYYLGSYSAADGLFFNTSISLADGYDNNVVFTLDGDNSQWFGLMQTNNMVELILISPIPAAVIANNQQLIFTLKAERPESRTAITVIAIIFSDEITRDQILGFDQVNYVGSLTNITVDLTPITLTEGYTTDVIFTLHGDLINYFNITTQQETVNMGLITPIPVDLIPSNRVIVLTLQASAPQAITAHATIVLKVQIDNDNTVPTNSLEFEKPYYVGNYTTAGGLVFDTTIFLVNGYDEYVTFSLEGEHSQWFALSKSENSINLTLSSVIPPAVIASNKQLIFTIRAERIQSTEGHATIIIRLIDEVTNIEVLAFEKINYVGSITNSTLNIVPIVLAQGYTSDVSFSIHGDLVHYFTLNSQNNIVTILLNRAIAEDDIPLNRIILLEVQASAPNILPSFATVVLGVVKEIEDVDNVSNIVFEEAYYTGRYSAVDGLVFNNTISLAEGYDDNIVFSLEGGDSQWFNLIGSGNSLSLSLASPIPPAVIANNHQIIFIMNAHRGSSIARAAIIILLPDETETSQILGFERINYAGSIANNTASLEPITLIEGYTADVTFTLHGEFEWLFSLDIQGATIRIVLVDTIPESVMQENRFVLLEIQASAPRALSAYATIIYEIITNNDNATPTQDLIFSDTYYVGSYGMEQGLTFDTIISLAEGFDETVQFSLDGDQSQWFNLIQTGNSVVLSLDSPIPSAVLVNNRQLLFVVAAQKPGSTSAKATIVIVLRDDITSTQILGFERINYIGSITNNTISLSLIVLSEGYTDNVTFSLEGDLSPYFTLLPREATVTLILTNPIPETLLPTNRIIILEVLAVAPDIIPAYATIVLEYRTTTDDNSSVAPSLIFEKVYYVGSYTTVEGLIFNDVVSLVEGYDGTVVFSLEGEHAQWFSISQSGNSVTIVHINPIPSAVLESNLQLIFSITAQRPGSNTAQAAIIITLSEVVVEGQALGFDRISYIGTIANNTAVLTPIVVNEGYSLDVSFTLYGEQANYFIIDVQGPVVKISLLNVIPVESVPANGIILLEIQASATQARTAYATIVFEVISYEDHTSDLRLVFEEAYYVGKYSAIGELSFDTIISLAEGFDEDVVFTLEGEYSLWFTLAQTGNSATLILSSPIPSSVIENYKQLLFVVNAQKAGTLTARAAVIIQLEQDTSNGGTVTFDKVLYKGLAQGETVQHDVITIIGYNGTNIDIVGEYAALFSASLNNGVVLVQAAGPLTLPTGLQNVVLELRAANVGAVLILDVSSAETPVAPSVTFSAASYVIRAEIGQTGSVGRVEATADNGEDVSYILLLNNEHLQSRLSVADNGELRLSAPANSGLYTFQVMATTVFTQASASATVYLSVEALTVCGNDSIVVAPLIVIDRDEEEPHRDLVILNTTEHSGCYFSLTNKWPIDQNWLYVDETGLHARSIDREDPSIAFMALSQVKVELTLHCDSDVARLKRSADTSLVNVPYNYGTFTWTLAKTILYNPRRSIVNLIVNDINDNTPIFIGKENEPIAVGYPTQDLEGDILPRSLVEVQATDADVGENAELLYWTSESVLAVSPKTGFVHVRNDAQLDQDMILTISATDRNGEGLTGTISLIVKLLDTKNIAVVTVRDAFLEDEGRILGNLSNAIGYEVRTLRAIVISDQTKEPTRNKRAAGDTGSSLELYVYGLIQREPVEVEQLSNDINNAAVVTVNIVSILSLEDHLEGQAICDIPGRDVGLLAATIVLSILLFILIVAAVVWFVLKRKKAQDYDKFSDANSVASQNESLGQNPKPDTVVKPRLNIEELKRSERRLQEMLNAPIEDINGESSTSTNDTTINSVTKIPLPDPLPPIVIQDKLKDAVEESDDDEFGERKKSRRKSVVTFNENVEKIIHVEDGPETPSEPTYEVFKL